MYLDEIRQMTFFLDRTALFTLGTWHLLCRISPYTGINGLLAPIVNTRPSRGCKVPPYKEGTTSSLRNDIKTNHWALGTFCVELALTLESTGSWHLLSIPDQAKAVKYPPTRRGRHPP